MLVEWWLDVAVELDATGMKLMTVINAATISKQVHLLRRNPQGR